MMNYWKQFKIKTKDVLNLYGRTSYSQEGEDLILDRIFNNSTNGFFVDVGAHHPLRFSNTYLFYKKGWTGINIDATPGSMKRFNKLRPKDINIEIPISDKSETLEYLIFNEPALNSFSKELSEKHLKHERYFVKQKVVLKTQTLGEVLNKNIPVGKTIDFLSIDVEGFDLRVLNSNDWQKFKPKVILVEDVGADLMSIGDTDISKFLLSKNYYVFAKTFNTFFYKLKENS